MSSLCLFLKNGYIHTPLANGIGRFVLQCQRMTLKFCKTSGGSLGVREYIEFDAVDFARKNPQMVLYLKPRRHRSPVVVAEYLNGHREWMSLENYSREEVGKWLDTFRTSSGTGYMRYKSYHKTDTPSIQGPWNPFTYTPMERNLAEFPCNDLKDPRIMEETATEYILNKYGKSVEQQSS